MLSLVGSLWYGATWWQAGLLAGLLGPAIYFGLPLLGSVIHKLIPATPNPPQPATCQLIGEELRERCCKLSAEIFDFYKRQRENTEQALQSDYMMALFEGPAGSQRRLEETERHNRWMIDEYSQQLGGAVSVLCDDLEPHGWCTPEDRERFESPTGPEDIRYAAQRLDAICRRFGGN